MRSRWGHSTPTTILAVQPALGQSQRVPSAVRDGVPAATTRRPALRSGERPARPCALSRQMAARSACCDSSMERQRASWSPVRGYVPGRIWSRMQANEVPGITGRMENLSGMGEAPPGQPHGANCSGFVNWLHLWKRLLSGRLPRQCLSRLKSLLQMAPGATAIRAAARRAPGPKLNRCGRSHPCTDAAPRARRSSRRRSGSSPSPRSSRGRPRCRSR